MNQPRTATIHRNSVLRGASLLALAVALVFGATACAKPTMEGAVSSYKKAKDGLDALVAKVSPVTKIDVRRKIKEFATEFEAAKKLDEEAGMKAIYALNRRMNDYRKKVDPSANKGAKPAGKGKLDNKPGAKTTVTPTKPAGSKLQPAGTKPGATKPVAPGASGFKPGDKPPAKNTAPSGGSGFGGK